MDLNATIVKTRALNGTIIRAAGGSGTSDYDALTNRPQINSVTLTGDLSSSDLGLADAADIPAPASSGTPAMDGTASRGTSSNFARADHVHPTDTSRAAAADVHSIPSGGSTGQVLKKTSGTDYDVAWANESGGGGTSDYTDLTNKPSINSVTLSGNKTAADLGLSAAVTEVTNSSTGAVSLSLEAENIYHFTGALTSLTITLTAPSSGLAHYHFDFDSGSTAPTLTLPNTVTMPSGFAVEASKHYEIDILNGYGAVNSWVNT